jgi:hypothetical protein
MKSTLIAALSIATAAALPLATVANACGGGGEIPEHREWVTPSGNIVCSVYGDGSGANCEIRDHDWAVPATTVGPDGRPCDFTFGGLQFYVSKGKPAMLGCYEGASSFNRPDLKTLDYGQSHSHGNVTCDSELSGVTCTDTATGHFFRVSRENYELG